MERKSMRKYEEQPAREEEHRIERKEKDTHTQGEKEREIMCVPNKEKERGKPREREMKKVTTSGTTQPATDYPEFALQPGITARGKD